MITDVRLTLGEQRSADTTKFNQPTNKQTNNSNNHQQRFPYPPMH